MKILYIHQYFKTPERSGGTRSWEFARRLVRDGNDVTVLCSGTKNRFYKTSGISVYEVAAPYANEMSMVARIKSFVQFAARSGRIAVSLKSDLVFATSTPLTVALPGLIASYLRRIPFVFEVRDLWPEVPIALGVIRSPLIVKPAQLLEKLAYHRASHVIALSPGMAEGVRKVNSKVPVTIVPNASDFALFDQSESERRATREWLDWGHKVQIVYAGSFGSSYDLEWAVRLAAELPPEKFNITLFGQGASTVPLRKLAMELGLLPDKLLPGSLPKEEVAGRVAAADLILSTLEAHQVLEMNSLNKVFDAFAAGRPIVFNHGGWLSDLATSRSAGWRVSRSPEEAAKQIEEIVSVRQYLEQSGYKARDIAVEQFDRESLYQELREVLLRQRRKGWQAEIGSPRS